MTDLQHPESRGFESVAELYDRVRPSYPPEAVAWIAEELELAPRRTVLDVGAGTGKLTRQLVATGARVIAVEPGAEMLGALRRVLPALETHLAGAEAIPLPDDSVDGVAIGQAFHWFRAEEAIPEIHRVLRPGGGLALIWNERDQADPFQRELNGLLEPFVPQDRGGSGEWTDALRRVTAPARSTPLFGPLEERMFTFVDELDGTGLAERIATISFVASAPPQERAALERELQARVAALGGSVAFAYATTAYVTRAE